jgi:DNA-binding transcriptional MerR regulator
MSTQRSYALSELVEHTGFDRRTIVYYIQSGLLPKVGRRGPHTRYPDECLSRLLFIKGVRELQAGGQLLTATLAEIGRALSALDNQGIRDILDRGLPSAEIERLFAVPTAPDPAPAEPSGNAHTGPAPTGPSPPQTEAPASRSEPASSSSGGDKRSYGLADASIRQRFAAERPSAASAEPVHEDTHPRLPVLQPGSAGMPASAGSTPDPGNMPGGTESPDASGDEHTDLGHLLRQLELRPTLNPRRSPPGAPEQWTEIPITSRVWLSVRGLPEEDAGLAEALARLLKRALRSRPSTT